MKDSQLPPAVEQRFCDAVVLWLATLIGVELLPIHREAVHSLSSVLIVGGVSALAIWTVRAAGPGDLEPPSRGRTASYTALGAVLTALLVVANSRGVGIAIYDAGLPAAVGWAATATVLTLIVGFWRIRVSVGAAIGGLTALAAGFLLGERDSVVLLCQFAFCGVALGAVSATALQRARELTRADLIGARGAPPC